MKFLSLCLCAILIASCAPVAKNEETPTSADEDTVRETLIDALLDRRLAIEVIREEGGRHGCEPQEPYYTLKIQRRISEPHLVNPTGPDGGTVEMRERLEETDLGNGLSVVERTGELRVMNGCAE